MLKKVTHVLHFLNAIVLKKFCLVQETGFAPQKLTSQSIKLKHINNFHLLKALNQFLGFAEMHGNLIFILLYYITSRQYVDPCVECCANNEPCCDICNNLPPGT